MHRKNKDIQIKWLLKKILIRSWFTLMKINVFPEKKLYSTRPEASHTMADMGLPKSPVCLCVTSFTMRDLAHTTSLLLLFFQKDASSHILILRPRIINQGCIQTRRKIIGEIGLFPCLRPAIRLQKVRKYESIPIQNVQNVTK